MNKVNKIIGFIKVSVIVLAFMLFSEFLFILNNNPGLLEKYFSAIKPQNIVRLYFETATQYEPKNGLDAYIYYKISPAIIFYYISESQNYNNSEACKPVCLSYDKTQALLSLFEKTNSNGNFIILSRKQKSELYFWMSTISIWDQNKNEETLSYLKKSLNLDNNNKNASDFYNALINLNNITDEQNREFFKIELKKAEPHEQYKRNYLAEAAFKMSEIYLTKDNNLFMTYATTAIDLNKWNETYYLNLFRFYETNNKSDSARKLLQMCIDNIKEPLGCKQAAALIKT